MNLTYSKILLLTLGTFAVTLIGMNIFYLPSIGFLASHPSEHHEKTMAEFTQTLDKEIELMKKLDNRLKPATKRESPNGGDGGGDDGGATETQTTSTPSKADGDKDGGTDVKANDATKADTDGTTNDGPTPPPKIAGLNCDRYGGPSEEIAAEMVYWRDIPSDAAFVSPFKTWDDSDPSQKKFLTFEPDEGGFNNIRMSMETATALAHATGRTLVLPPEQSMYLLGKDHRKENNRFTFKSFFPFDAIANEHDAVEVIGMEEFLRTEVMNGFLKDADGKAVFPPGNKTDWDGHLHHGRQFWDWFRGVTMASTWDFSKCTGVFPEKPGHESQAVMQNIFDGMDMNKQNHGLYKSYVGNPRRVDGETRDRLHEQLAFRKQICMYNTTMQDAQVLHFMGDNASGARLLVHFYAFLFFQDWKQDLWTKRYVRDHLRYIDTIQCGAATIVNAVRAKAREHGDETGTYDSMHIRRGDFQYKQTRIEADEIYRNVADIFPENTTLFIATDERQKDFFKPLRDHYHVYFLDDFLHLLPESFNKNYYGMLDQRIASRGRTFAGAFYSTFTGYINRMRGYHSQKEKPEGYLEGDLNSYFYVPLGNKHDMKRYSALRGPLWGREFPVAWRDIDHDLEDHHIVAR